MESTPEEIRLDVWANHYANAKPGVEETEAVDDEFDLDAVLSAAESGDWEDVFE